MKDLDVRGALQRTHLKQFDEDGDSRIIQELDICNGEARIDIAIVNGHIHGLEIKSEQDTLARLPHQIDVYSKVFDYLTLVVARSHIDAARKILPKTWGIMQASMRKNVQLKSIKGPELNNDTDAVAICQFLWKEELVALLEAHCLPPMPQKTTKIEFCQFLSESVEKTCLVESVRKTLKARTSWRVEPPLRQNGGSSRRKPSLSGFQVLPLSSL